MTARPLVVHVSHQDPRHCTGGQGIVVRDICRAQLRMGYPVQYLSMRLRGEPPVESFPYDEGTLTVERLGVGDSDEIDTPYAGDECRQLTRRLAFNEHCVRILRDADPARTVLHLHGFYAIPLLAGMLPHLRSVTTYHLLLSTRMQRVGAPDPMLHTIRHHEIASFLAARVVHAVSPGMAGDILALARTACDPAVRAGVREIARRHEAVLHGLEDGDGGVSRLADRIRVVPNPIGWAFLSPALAAPVAGRVLAWGRISAEKGFEHVVEAARLLPHLSFRILGITGQGERDRDAYADQLREAARVLPNVALDFRGTGVRGEELLRAIDEAEIAVAPSHYESFGLVLPEAMARGTPVVTTATAGGEYIFGSTRHGRHDFGFLVPVERAKITPGLVESLRCFFTLDEDARERMRRAARQQAARFGPDRIVQDLSALYAA